MAAVLISAVLIVLIVVTQRGVLLEHEQSAALVYNGGITEPVDAERFTLNVKKIQFASTVRDVEILGDASARKTSGTWIVIWAEVTSKTDPLHFSDPVRLVSASGYSYDAAERVRSSFNETSLPLQPGLTLKGAFVFEVPLDRIEDPVLRVPVAESLDDRLSAEAAVDLNLDADRMRELKENMAESIKIKPAAYL